MYVAEGPLCPLMEIRTQLESRWAWPLIRTQLPGPRAASRGPRPGGRGQPAGVDQDRRSSPEPIRVVDRQIRVGLASHRGQGGADQGADLACAEGAGVPLEQRGGAAAEIEGRPGQAQRLQRVDAAVLEDTDAHGRELRVAARGRGMGHSTVTLLARLRGLSMSQPRSRAMWYAT